MSIGLRGVVLVSLLAAWSCDQGGSGQLGPAEVRDTGAAGLERVMRVQARITGDLLRDSGVVGTGVGWTEDSVPALFVLTKTAAAAGRLPDSVAGVRLIPSRVGGFKPYAAPPSSPTVVQDFPVKMGTSGGWAYDANSFGCCGGTLGALLTDGKKRYVLSNWHVLQSDRVPGANGRVSQARDSVVQPSMVDAHCDPSVPRAIGLVYGPPSLPMSNVDAALAEALPGRVDATGYILNVGIPSRSPLAPRPGLRVKKMGRTTGLTRASIAMINVTIAVPYPGECGGKIVFTKVFTGQILVRNPKGAFLQPGDSGALLLEDAGARPRPVGLLFAGNDSYAVANPIADVLAYCGMSLVGE